MLFNTARLNKRKLWRITKLTANFILFLCLNQVSRICLELSSVSRTLIIFLVNLPRFDKFSRKNKNTYPSFNLIIDFFYKQVNSTYF